MDEIVLTLPSFLLNNSHVVGSLTSCFILHIIYMRGLIPAPFSVMQREVCDMIGASRSKKMRPAEKKLIIFVNQMERLLKSLNDIVRATVSQEVCLLLGPSSNNVKESYKLHFQSDNSVPCGDYFAVVSQKVVDKFKRQLIHKLIEHYASDNVNLLPKTNIFVALQAQKIAVSQTQFIKSITDEYHSLNCTYEEYERRLTELNAITATASQSVTELFVFKESFKIREKKRGPLPLNVRITRELTVTEIAAEVGTIEEVRVSIEQHLPPQLVEEQEEVDCSEYGTEYELVLGDSDTYNGDGSGYSEVIGNENGCFEPYALSSSPESHLSANMDEQNEGTSDGVAWQSELCYSDAENENEDKKMEADEVAGREDRDFDERIMPQQEQEEEDDESCCMDNNVSEANEQQHSKQPLSTAAWYVLKKGVKTVKSCGASSSK